MQEVATLDELLDNEQGSWVVRVIIIILANAIACRNVPANKVTSIQVQAEKTLPTCWEINTKNIVSNSRLEL